MHATVKDKAFSGQVLATRSIDGGRSFAELQPITASNESQRFAALGLDADGSVFAAWIDKRNRVPAQQEGKLRTRCFLVPRDRLTVNAKTTGGDVRVRLLDQSGKPLSDLGEPEARPITGDALAAEVQWKKPLAALRGKPVRLDIVTRQAALFGLAFHDKPG